MNIPIDSLYYSRLYYFIVCHTLSFHIQTLAIIQQIQPFSFLSVWTVLHPYLLLMSNEELDTLPPTLPTLFLPHCVKSSAWVIICVFHARLLQCRHTETPGVRLVRFRNEFQHWSIKWLHKNACIARYSPGRIWIATVWAEANDCAAFKEDSINQTMY